MRVETPIACGICQGGVALSICADWVERVTCPTCHRTAGLDDAFREAEACEATYLASGDLHAVVDGFVTARLLCVMRRRA